MKRARDHTFIMADTSALYCAKTIGSESMAIVRSITSVDYMSLKEQTLMVHGIRIISTAIAMAMARLIIISLLMIYLANADQLLNSNTMMRT